MRHGNVPESSRPVRLLIVCSTLHIGGAEQVAASIAKNVESRHFHVQVCCLKENGVVGRSIQAQGISLRTLGKPSSGHIDRLTSLKLLSLIRREKIDVIHTHDVHGLMDASVCRRVCGDVRHVHTFHFGNYPNRDRSSWRAERLCWRSPDALVAVGHVQAEKIQDLYAIPKSRLRVIWNGVESGSLAPACDRRLLLDGPRPVVLSVSTLIEQKGIANLLQAARLLKNEGYRFRLIIAGHGHLRDSLEQMSRSLAINDRVEFLGWVPNAAQRILPACDVFVQSSLWEAMSVVVLEAMAAARPLVVTRVGENEHVIEHERSGLVVPPSDARALADALAKVLTDDALAARLGQSARRRYLERFTMQPMLDAYEALYLELADSIRSRRA